MSLRIGIVGLPNVGKSTLFNALTANGVEASNYPFCTIDPNVGVVPVPDSRLAPLAEVVQTKNIVPATVEFVDIAGLVAGAYKGEGLGNRFLAHIREADAIVEVVRGFEDENIVHVDGRVDPDSDMETIMTELVLADLETMTKRLTLLEKECRADAKRKSELEFAKGVVARLESGEPVREMDLKDEEAAWLHSWQLISSKPHLYVLNVDEEGLRQGPVAELAGRKMLRICASVEAELAEMEAADRAEFLAEYGMDESGLERLAREAYALLGLQSYFTAGEKEVRAWTICQGWKAPKAAGVIHTDFEKGFIKAETIAWNELVALGGWQEARAAGKVRLEGKEYEVREGDVMLFRFNV